MLTVVEVGKILRIRRTYAYELIASGKLRSVRMGRAIRVPREALDVFMGTGRSPSTRPVPPEPASKTTEVTGNVQREAR